MYLLIVLLPLIGSLTAGFFGRFIGSQGATLITPICVFISFLFSCTAFYEVALCQSPCSFKLFSWINSEMMDFHWGFLFDSLTVVMLIVVTCVSTIVHLYSIGYMEMDPHLPRFMSYLSLFTFFMLILVTADNLIQMFVGWEGVGLCSYLLINFWHTRLQANKAAIKAVIVNRVGDFGLVLGVLGIFYLFKTVNYSTLFALVPYTADNVDLSFNILGFNFNILTFICVFLFIGSVGKSAQVGLHTWLPDAMEGPTPVSALIHAATMVTAGVFLLARCSPLFEYAPNALTIVTFVGAMTAFFAATTALVQNDLKRVIAYSTCSQLGYMVFACGISNYNVSVFHLANHAFFKALLFLSAGSVIHALADEQDMRKMGGVIKLVPYTYAMMFIGSLSLMGFPFLTGFYSKDAILELAYGSFTISGHFAHWLGTISAFMTAFYSMRLIYLTFINKTNAYKQSIQGAHDLPKIMGYPLVVLVFGSIFIGYLTKDMIIGVGTHFWGNAIFILPQNLIIFDAEFLPHSIKMIPVIFSLSGVFLAYILYCVNPLKLIYTFKMTNFGLAFYNYFNRKWFFDKVYNEFINQVVLKIGYHKTYKLIDRGVIENLGPFGFSKLFYASPMKLNFLQTGLIYHSAFMMLVGIILLFILIGFSSWFGFLINLKLIAIFCVAVFVTVYIKTF
jgi:proton-translocating NADH-quinone oxidoreductase chain L